MTFCYDECALKFAVIFATRGKRMILKGLQNVNVYVDVYSVISTRVQQTTIYTPWYWNSLLYSLISSGESSTHFLQLMPFTITGIRFFISPGTHDC